MRVAEHNPSNFLRNRKGHESAFTSQAFITQISNTFFNIIFAYKFTKGAGNAN